jgi:hypothetical protein
MVVMLTTDEFADLVRDVVAAEIAKPVARVLDRAGLAAALAVSLPTIDRWRREGMPSIQRGEVYRFEIDRVAPSWRRTSAGEGRCEVSREIGRLRGDDDAAGEDG